MVEARQEDSPNLGHDTYSPGGGYFALQSESQSHQKDDSFDITPQQYPSIHDSGGLVTPTIFPGLRGNLDKDVQELASSSLDAIGHMSESSKPEQPKAGSSNYRSRSRIQHSNAQQPSGSRSSQPPQSPNYVLPSSATLENIHSHPSSFQGTSIHYPSASMPYDSQWSGYVGQYTMYAQPNPMAISPPPYATAHAYHHPVGPDRSSMNIHANYSNMLQPQAPFLPFQRPSLEGTSSSHHSFHGMRSPPMYGTHHSPSPTSSHPTPSGQRSALGTPYMGSNIFHSLQYPTLMATSPYPYTARTYPSSPLYPPQFSSPPFGQHYSPPPEFEPQGTWFYLPHPSPQHLDASQYQLEGPHLAGYSQARHSSMDTLSDQAVWFSTNISQSFPPPHFILPTQPNPSQYSGTQTPSDSAGPSSSSGRPPASTSDRLVVRRSYHPNPPAHRSEWVMWAGNVPSDASHDELWRFFNQPLPSSSQSPSPLLPSSHIQTSGVLSIFLISRSSCAFVNYDTEDNLKQAIARFNGVRLRAHDSRCPRLLCRVRRKDDDLKAGVGGQRGMGMHTNWVKEQNIKSKGKERDTSVEDSYLDVIDSPVSPTSVSDRLSKAVSNISVSGNVHANHSSSSGSYTSTNSSFLAKYFPRRYFILKSLTQEDLDLSVARNVWATQKHNEEILDQAFRSSRDVYLIFSVNKSGEFYGYARMSGPVQRGEHRIIWASRPAPVARVSSPALLTHSTATHPILSASPNRYIENSPQPVDSSTPGPASNERTTTGGILVKPTSKAVSANLRHSAPALLGEGYHLPSGATFPVMRSLDHRTHLLAQAGNPSGKFVLDPDALVRAIRANTGSSSSSGSGSGSEQDKVDLVPMKPSLRSVEEEEEKVGGLGFDLGQENEPRNPLPDGPVGKMGTGGEGPAEKEEEVWGDTFAVQWICTNRVPFLRTKHLRNPWNHNREIKISRDGTELEPSVGQRLLEEWASLADPQTQTQTQLPSPQLSRAGKSTTGGKRLTNTNTRS